MPQAKRDQHHVDVEFELLRRPHRRQRVLQRPQRETLHLAIRWGGGEALGQHHLVAMQHIPP